MWWLRRHLGIPKSTFPKYEYNLAAAGRYIGIAATGPAIGVIVVWRHHVGIISGQSAAGWIVTAIIYEAKHDYSALPDRLGGWRR